MRKRTERTTVNVFIRIGQAALLRMTRGAERAAKTRSAWAELAIIEALQEGLASTVRSDLLLEAMQKDERATLRIEEGLAGKMTARAEELGLTVTDFVMLAAIGKIEAELGA